MLPSLGVAQLDGPRTNMSVRLSASRTHRPADLPRAGAGGDGGVHLRRRVHRQPRTWPCRRSRTLTRGGSGSRPGGGARRERVPQEHPGPDRGRSASRSPAASSSSRSTTRRAASRASSWRRDRPCRVLRSLGAGLPGRHERHVDRLAGRCPPGGAAVARGRSPRRGDPAAPGTAGVPVQREPHLGREGDRARHLSTTTSARPSARAPRAAPRTGYRTSSRSPATRWTSPRRTSSGEALPDRTEGEEPAPPGGAHGLAPSERGGNGQDLARHLLAARSVRGLELVETQG